MIEQCSSSGVLSVGRGGLVLRLKLLYHNNRTSEISDLLERDSDESEDEAPQELSPQKEILFFCRIVLGL